MAGNLSAKKEEAIVKEAKEAYDAWSTYFQKNNNHFDRQMKFWLTAINQWEPQERSQMTSYNKIPLVCPKIYGIGRRIIGEQRQCTPDLQVMSITDKATPEEISLHDDYVRTVTAHSDAHVAYQTAFMHQLYGGYGAIKVGTEYENENGFDERFKIEAINEPNLCFWDPGAKKSGKEDGLYCGEIYGMTRKHFEKKYPDIEVPDNETLPRSGVTMADKDKVFILIYQRKEYKKKTIVQLQSGDVLDYKDYEKALNAFIDEALAANPDMKHEEIELPDEFKVAKKRQTSDYKIRTYKIAGNRVLEHTTWPSKYFSYVFVDGDSHYVNGGQVTRTFFQDAKDIQIFMNYLFTQINHLVKAQRNELWMASPPNVSGFEDIWNNPDLTQSVLLATPDQNRGGAMPEKIPAPEISQTLINLYKSGQQDINTTLGIYDAYEGNAGNETSGKAIENRVKQGNIATFIVFSNLNRAIGQVGCVLLYGFHMLYDTMRPISLKSRDGSTRNVMLNNPVNGIIENDTSYKDYYIEIDAGSSFQGQRQESLMALKDMMAASSSSPLFNLIADVYAENMNLPNNQVMVKRLRATVPPEIVAAGNGEEPPPQEPPPPPPEVEFMKADIALREQKIKQDAETKMRELDFKERQLELDREKAEVQADIQNQKLMVDKAKVGLY